MYRICEDTTFVDQSSLVWCCDPHSHDIKVLIDQSLIVMYIKCKVITAETLQKALQANLMAKMHKNNQSRLQNSYSAEHNDWECQINFWNNFLSWLYQVAGLDSIIFILQFYELHKCFATEGVLRFGDNLVGEVYRANLERALQTFEWNFGSRL